MRRWRGIESTLDWFHDGAWRPFGRFGRGAFKQVGMADGSAARPATSSRDLRMSVPVVTANAPILQSADSLAGFLEMSCADRMVGEAAPHAPARLRIKTLAVQCIRNLRSTSRMGVRDDAIRTFRLQRPRRLRLVFRNRYPFKGHPDRGSRDSARTMYRIPSTTIAGSVTWIL